MEQDRPAWAITDEELKGKFAALLYKFPDSPQHRKYAAEQLFPGPHNVGIALQIAYEWPHDPVVIRIMEELRRQIGPEDLATQEELARDIWNLARDPQKTTSERLAAYKLYGEVRGFISKPGTTINNNTQVNMSGVALIPEPAASIEEWAEMAAGRAAMINAK